MRIRHRGLLRAPTERNRVGQLPQDLVPKLRPVLALLDEARHSGDLSELPGYRLHPLKGDMAGPWSIRVSGNWRVLFPDQGQRSGGRGLGGLPLRGRGYARWRC
ncbi:MAG: type II toxin-antitoxin system RelE/ParE family toxin [Rhodospirillaceae bacterium]|nr:type II toxin-antitoxin system RelE/ParE family toxin [Rhodospirillaceae bacterium]